MDYLLCGDLPYPAGKKHISVQNLSNRRIRRYLVCRLKRPEARGFSHVRFTVFIHGDMSEKTERIMCLYHVEEKEAVKMMADTDKRRMTNYSFYTDQKWGKASNYTLCLNSSQLGYDRCEKIIVECSK